MRPGSLYMKGRNRNTCVNTRKITLHVKNLGSLVCPITPSLCGTTLSKRAKDVVHRTPCKKDCLLLKDEINSNILTHKQKYLFFTKLNVSRMANMALYR